jgi:histone H3/H4
MAETWLKCSACRNPIPFHATHWVCSVSTCNRKATGYVFCTVSCWDSHVAEARHRDAWAVEARAPSKDAWDKEQAANPPPAAPAPRPVAPSAPIVRRVVGEAPPPSQAASPPVVRRVVGDAPAAPAPTGEGTVQLAEVTDKDVLVVVSKLKKYIKDRSGFNTSDAVVDLLSDHVRAVCDDAIRAAARDERKTVLERDIPRPPRR